MEVLCICISMCNKGEILYCFTKFDWLVVFSHRKYHCPQCIWKLARNLNLTRIVKSSSCNQCFTYKLGKFLYFAYNTVIFHKRQYCKFTDNGSKIPRNIFSKENWLSCNLVEKHHEICHQYSNISITYSCKDLWYYDIPEFSRKMMAKLILYSYHTSKKSQLI